MVSINIVNCNTNNIPQSPNALLIFIIYNFNLAFTPLPDSYSPENKRAQLRRMINLRVNPITGLTSNWDYEKMDWKRKTWNTPDNPFIEEECEDNEFEAIVPFCKDRQ